MTYLGAPILTVSSMAAGYAFALDGTQQWIIIAACAQGIGLVMCLFGE